MKNFAQTRNGETAVSSNHVYPIGLTAKSCPTSLPAPLHLIFSSDLATPQWLTKGSTWAEIPQSLQNFSKNWSAETNCS